MTRPTIIKEDPVHGVTEKHPAFGQISVSRVHSGGGTGRHLYDSDVGHREFISLRIEQGQRTRAISHDYHHGTEIIAEIEMSMAQWASFVSSFNTSGVPCTIVHRRDGNLIDVEDLDDEPRLAKTMYETKNAASQAFNSITTEVKELDRLIAEKASVREIRESLRTLKFRIQNATPNVDYATRTLAEHAEGVIQKARADIESMVAQHVEHLGLEAGSVPSTIQLNSGDN